MVPINQNDFRSRINTFFVTAIMSAALVSIICGRAIYKYF